MGGLRAAGPEDVEALHEPLVASGLFDSDAHIVTFVRQGPWRIQVTDSSEIVVMDRWREHLGLACLRGVFAEESRVPTLVCDACSVVAALGYERLLSPLLVGSAATPYRRAGMTVHQKVAEMAAGPTVLRSAGRTPDGSSTVEVASEADLEGILLVDAASFDPFWAFDEEQMRERSSRDRTTVVKVDGQVVGFALMSVSRGAGHFHRLAVMPEERGKGVGSALLAEALSWMGESGAEVALVNTQEGNYPAQRLYRSQGFRRNHESLTILISDRL